MLEYFNSFTVKQRVVIVIIGVVILFMIGLIIYYNVYSTDNDLGVDIVSENEVENVQTESGFFTSNPKEIMVHVVGEVNNPGVVKLKEGARIKDAIDAAGGMSEEADLSKVNLAYFLEDGIQVKVPSINEEYSAENDVIASSVGTANQVVKVNINTASLEKLTTIPGVGQSTAQKIIDYRNSNGRFNTIEDIKKVSGIGDAKFDKIKNYIKVT